MPKFDLGVACDDSGLARRHIESLIEYEFEDIEVPEPIQYAIMYRVTFENLTKVIEVKNQIEKKAGNDISSITIYAR